MQTKLLFCIVLLLSVTVYAQMPAEVVIANPSQSPVWVRVKNETGAVLQDPVLLQVNGGTGPIKTNGAQRCCQ